MSSANIELVFEGPAVQSGTIDARLLAESLNGYSSVFRRANEIVNGELSKAAVLVQADFKAGSFVAGLQFVQNITEEAEHLITAHQFMSAGAIAGLIGFLPAELAKEFIKDFSKETVIGLFKWLKGKKPDDVKRVDNDEVQIKAGQENKTVSTTVYNMYGDSAIRLGLDKLTAPLREAQIDRIAVKQDNTEQTVFEKSEAEYFEAEPPLQLEVDEQAMEGERDAVLVVSKLSFKEGTNWTFFKRGATVVAKIEDEEFWGKVHQHTVTFGEGDLLKVRLAWKIQQKQHQLKQKNTIVKVIEKLERPKQLHLDGRRDNLLLKQPQGRKFR